MPVCLPGLFGWLVLLPSPNNNNVMPVSPSCLLHILLPVIAQPLPALAACQPQALSHLLPAMPFLAHSCLPCLSFSFAF